MSAETKTPDAYKKSLNASELSKISSAMGKLKISNQEEPLLKTYPTAKVKEEPKVKEAKATARGKSIKTHKIDMQEEERQKAEQQGTKARRTKVTLKRDQPQNNNPKESLSKLISTLPEGRRATRALTRKLREQLTLAQKKGVKKRTLKVRKTNLQKAREQRRKAVTLRRLQRRK